MILTVTMNPSIDIAYQLDELRIDHAVRAKEIIRNERATKRSYLRAGLNLVNNPVGATEIISATEFFAEW